MRRGRLGIEAALEKGNTAFLCHRDISQFCHEFYLEKKLWHERSVAFVAKHSIGPQCIVAWLRLS